MPKIPGREPDNNNTTPPLFTEKERDYFLQNIFYHDTVDSSFFYRGKSAELFNELAESEYSTHYIAEKELIVQKRNKIQKLLGKNITDFGCGDGEKAALLLEGIDKPFQYVAADYSSEMIRIAEERLKKNWNATFGQNFLLNGKRFTLGKELSDNTYLWLGETMSNFGDYRIVEYFKDMGNTGFVHGNKILFSFALEPTDEKAFQQRIACYDNPLAENFVMSAVEQLGVPRDKFLYTVKSTPSGDIQVGIVAKEDQNIQLSNRSISINEGTFFPLHQNRTFDKEHIRGLLKRAKCDTKFFVEKDGVGLMLVEKLPEKREKYGHQVRNRLLGALLIGSGIGIKTGIDVHHNTKEINTAKQELLKDKDPKDYGFKPGNSADYLELKEALTKKVQQESLAIYDDILIIHKNSNVRDKQSILYLIQSALLNKQPDGTYVDFSRLESDPAYRLVFIQNFLKNYRVVLANLGVNLLKPYADILDNTSSFKQTLEIDGEIKGWMGTLDDRSMPTSQGCFLANQENSTIFGQMPLPENLNATFSDTTLMKNPAFQRRWEDAVKNFEHYKNSFPFKQDLGKYRHSDGRLFQVVLVSKDLIVANGHTKEYLIILAADISTKETLNQAGKVYSLSNGKEVIEDIQATRLD